MLGQLRGPSYCGLYFVRFGFVVVLRHLTDKPTAGYDFDIFHVQCCQSITKSKGIGCVLR